MSVVIPDENTSLAALPTNQVTTLASAKAVMVLTIKHPPTPLDSSEYTPGKSVIVFLYIFQLSIAANPADERQTIAVSHFYFRLCTII